MLMLAATGLLQRFGDMIVVGLVLALIAYGAHFGLFLAVLAGMHALVSIVVPPLRIAIDICGSE